MGPTNSNPGPMLLSIAIDALAALEILIPSRESPSVLAYEKEDIQKDEAGYTKQCVRGQSPASQFYRHYSPGMDNLLYFSLNKFSQYKYPDTFHSSRVEPATSDKH